jgi:phenylalanyl-tRNA synthetase beta chain
MKVTLNWLKQYVDFNWSPEELTGRLTMLGLEVEGVQKLGGEFEGIVVAEVITRDKHPSAASTTVAASGRSCAARRTFRPATRCR